MKLVWLVTSVCVCTSSTLRSCVPQPLHQSDNLAFAVVDPRAARHGRGGGERRGRCGGMGGGRRLWWREEGMRCAAVSPRASSRRRRGRRQGEVEASSSKQLRLGSERKVEAEEGGGLDGKPVAAGEGATLVVAGAKQAEDEATSSSGWSVVWSSSPTASATEARICGVVVARAGVGDGGGGLRQRGRGGRRRRICRGRRQRNGRGVGGWGGGERGAFQLN